MAEQARDGPAEAVNRLVRVTHHDEPGARFGRSDQPQQLKLRRVDILKLVHEHEPEPGAQPLAQRGRRLQQLDGARDEVAEVNEPDLAHALLVRLVDHGQHPQPLAGACLGR